MSVRFLLCKLWVTAASPQGRGDYARMNTQQVAHCLALRKYPVNTGSRAFGLMKNSQGQALGAAAKLPLGLPAFPVSCAWFEFSSSASHPAFCSCTYWEAAADGLGPCHPRGWAWWCSRLGCGLGHLLP